MSLDPAFRDDAAYGEGPNEGSTSIIEGVVIPTYVKHGIPVTSRKRWETYGNPSSDHYYGNRDADAADGGVANAFWLHAEITRKFVSEGMPLNAPLSDYVERYCTTPNLRRFRVQCIAETHGTGPHYHSGVRHV